MTESIKWQITSQVSCELTEDTLTIMKGPVKLNTDLSDLDKTLAVFMFDEIARLTPEEKRRIILELEDVMIGEAE